MSSADFAHLACPNPDCAAYGQRGAGCLRLHGHSDKGRRLRCPRRATCGTDFSERANTPLFGLRPPMPTLVAIAEHLVEGTGVRATAGPCKVSLNTVLCFTKRFGRHAERFHDTQVRGIRPQQIQPDEAWAFVGKKTNTATRTNQPTPPRAVSGTM